MAQKEMDESKKITAVYRREASELASSLGARNNIATSLQQCLGRNALAEEDPSCLDIPSSFSYCHACGSLLQFGKNGTTLRLRSVGRGKTRRRRASRRKAAEFRARKQSSVTGGRKWKDDNSHNDDNKEERDLMRVTDGTCRNAIVVTCGSCGYKLKYKGLPPVRQQQERASTKEEQKKPAATSPKGLGDGDLVSLPGKGAGERRSKGARRKIISTRKKPNKKPSDLLNFLSSLND